jgi:exopolysaccharide production protein ExoQ
MPSNVAALICSLFILIVFVIDSKRKPNVSFSHWVAFIWFLIVSSRPVVQWIDITAGAVRDATDPGSSPIDATILTVLLISGIAILSRRTERCKEVLRNNLWLVLLILYCLISILWSDYPAVSFKRWFRGMGTFIMVLVVVTEADPLETVRTMLRRCAFLTIPLSLLFIKYFRDLGVYYESWGAIGYSGVTTGKNLLGRLCLILGFYFFWEIVTNWKNQNNKSADVYKAELFINITFLIMILWLLLLVNSATSLGCLIIAICILLFLNFPGVRRNITNINITIILLVLIFFILDFTFDLSTIFITSLGRDTTLTGRTELWSICLKFVENPLIGVGYDSFWLGKRLELIGDKLGWYPMQAHNGYIDVYLQIGIIGMFLLLGVLVSIYNNIRKVLVNDFQLGCFQFSFLIQYLLYNITENAFKLQSFFWFVFLLIELTKTQKE